jgi:predicted HAD superfamily phosphohydrolase YqeG
MADSILDLQIFPSGLAARIKVNYLAYSKSPVPTAIAKAVKVKHCTMEDTCIVTDS